MNQVKYLILKMKQWVSDPFGRKQLVEKHEHVLERMRETTAAVSTLSQERFPISKMVGHSRPKRQKRSAQHAR